MLSHLHPAACAVKDGLISRVPCPLVSPRTQRPQVGLMLGSPTWIPHSLDDDDDDTCSNFYPLIGWQSPAGFISTPWVLLSTLVTRLLDVIYPRHPFILILSFLSSAGGRAKLSIVCNQQYVTIVDVYDQIYLYSIAIFVLSTASPLY